MHIISPLPAVPKSSAPSKPHTPSTIFWHPHPSAPSVPDSPVQTPHRIPFTRPFTPSPKSPSELSFPPAEPSLKSTTKSDKAPSGISSGPVIFALVVAGVIIISVIGFVLWHTKSKRRIHHGDNYFGLFSGSSSYKAGQSSSRPCQQPQTPLRDHQNGFKGYSDSIAGGTLGVPQPMNSSSRYGWGNLKFGFSYEHLAVATNGFSTENQLGEGGFGWVYRGQLPDGQVVAVKQLKVGGGQGEHEFQAEVEFIGRVHHRNLVSLVGYCATDTQRLLIYEYVPNGNLEQHLHGKGRHVMDWATRSKIAIGSARGLAYLHEDCHPQIIHQDIKSSNILLDNNFEARVSDFGLAKLAPDTYTHETTCVMRTFGYLAPEYASNGKLTERSDVYSFGVLLLELVTGRRPVDTSQPVGNESLVEWARPLLNHALEDRNLEGLADPKLENNYDRDEMFRMLQAAVACVRHSAQRRPCMRQVARALESDGGHYDLSNGVKPGHSAEYSADNAAFIKRIRMMAFGNQEYGTHDYSFSSTNEYGLSHFVSSSTLANNNITEGKPLRYQKPGTELPSFGSHDEQEIGSR